MAWYGRADVLDLTIPVIMDHIPRITDSKYPPVEVPVLNNNEGGYPCAYDNHPDGWSNYPKRMGWDKRAMITHGDFTQNGTKSPEEAASFLQAWLYFGVIEYFFEITPVDATKSFITRNSKGVAIVTTRYLVAHIIDWHRKLRALPEQEHLRILSRAIGLMEELSKFISACLNPPPRAAYGEIDSWIPDMVAPLPPAVILSIQILAEELEYARQLADWKIPEGGANFFDRSCNFLTARFEDGYWCPSDVRYFSKFSVATQYLISTLGPSRSNKSHAGCRDWVCHTMDIDESNYETKHVEGCRCRGFISADPELTGSILRKGRIPLITVSVHSMDRPVRITIKETAFSETERPSEPYIAISHVWADGLGNPHSNSLPQCQLLRLQLLVNQLGGRNLEDSPTPFWIDTLCVPITSDGEERKLAISRLSETYREATAVLVLDADLMSASSLVSGFELFARMITCNWMRRLWTLQEAVFARKLAVQFLDQAVDMDQIFIEGSLAYQEAKQPSMFLSIAPWYSDIRGHVRQAEVYDEMIFDIVHLMRCRSTSHERDEVLCLAGLLRFTEAQIRSLLEVPESVRRTKFIDMKALFPRDFVFGAGQKMAEDGYRWCPRSFLQHDPASELGHQWDPASFNPEDPESSPRPAHRMLTKGKRGLLGTFLGFRLCNEQGIPIEDMFNFTDPTTKCTYMVKSAKQSPDGGSNERRHWINDLAHAALISDPLSLRKGAVSRAALVDITGQDGDVVLARFCSRAWIGLEGKYTAEEEEHLSQSLELPRIQGSSFGAGQKWCIL